MGSGYLGSPTILKDERLCSARRGDRARDRLGIDKDSPPEERIQFRDLRALDATDAAKAGKKMDEIQARLTHTSPKTSEICIKEAIAQVSDMNLPLPWSPT